MLSAGLKAGPSPSRVTAGRSRGTSRGHPVPLGQLRGLGSDTSLGPPRVRPPASEGAACPGPRVQFGGQRRGSLDEGAGHRVCPADAPLTTPEVCVHTHLACFRASLPPLGWGWGGASLGAQGAGGGGSLLRQPRLAPCPVGAAHGPCMHPGVGAAHSPGGRASGPGMGRPRGWAGAGGALGGGAALLRKRRGNHVPGTHANTSFRQLSVCSHRVAAPTPRCWAWSSGWREERERPHGASVCVPLPPGLGQS